MVRCITLGKNDTIDSLYWMDKRATVSNNYESCTLSPLTSA